MKFDKKSILSASQICKFALIILAILVEFVYLFYFFTSLSVMWSTIETNSKYANANLENGFVKQVLSSETKDGKTVYELAGDESVTNEYTYGSFIYNLVCVSEVFSSLDTTNEVLTVRNTGIFDDVERNEKGVYIYKLASTDTTIECGYGDIVFSLYVNKDGQFLIDIPGQEEPIVLDSIYGVETLYTDKEKCRLKINTTCKYESEQSEICFVNGLPTDDLYIDTVSGSLLRNTSKDFIKTIILSSNAIVVLCCILMVTILESMAKHTGKLKDIRGVSVLIGLGFINSFLLGLMIVMSYIMFV